MMDTARSRDGWMRVTAGLADPRWSLRLSVESEGATEEVELQPQQVLRGRLGTGQVGHVRKQRQLVPPTGLEQRGGELERMSCHDVVVGQAVDQQERPRQA